MKFSQPKKVKTCCFIKGLLAVLAFALTFGFIFPFAFAVVRFVFYSWWLAVNLNSLSFLFVMYCAYDFAISMNLLIHRDNVYKKLSSIIPSNNVNWTYLLN